MNLFKFEKTEIRVLDKNDERWFFAWEICEALEIANSRDAVSRLDEDEKGVAFADTPGGRQPFQIVSLAGVFSLVLRSKKKEARAFRRWLLHEVLPALYHNGSYSVVRASEIPAQKWSVESMRLVAIGAQVLGISKMAFMERAVLEYSRQLPAMLRRQAKEVQQALASFPNQITG
jgi:prophage antirepressor-like protein